MAREYPRFVFADPQNTKSKGPFVIHLLEPRIVFKVVVDKTKAEQPKVTLYDCDYPEGDAQIDAIAGYALEWLTLQVRLGFIKLS